MIHCDTGGRKAAADNGCTTYRIGSAIPIVYSRVKKYISKSELKIKNNVDFFALSASVFIYYGQRDENRTCYIRPIGL